MQPEHQQNFILDLKKAQQTTLLIDTQDTDDKDFLLAAAQRVYDQDLPTNKTNLIYINTNQQKFKEKFMLLEVLLEMLGQDLERFQKIRGGLEIAKGVLSGAYITGKSLIGGIGIDFGTYIEDSLGKFADQTIDWSVDKFVDATADTTQEVIIAGGQTLTVNLANNRLLLSSEAKEEFINALLEKLEQDTSLVELLYLTEVLLKVCSLPNKEPKAGTPFFSKLIIIEDPCGLDSISMALLTHLLSVCKDQKDLSYQLSFLYVRTKPDPKEGEIADALIDQRTFALRYGMYETPQADYPNRLITPDLFAGREDELQELVQTASGFYQSNNKTNLISRVIVGEPGMGKTRLVQEHHKQFISELKAEKDKKLIKQEAFTLKLTLYCDNQLSVSSGLSSILASLENEIDRIAEAYKQHKTLATRFGDFKDGLIDKAIEEILPLYKEYQQVKEGLQAWNRDMKQAVNQKSEQSMALLDDSNLKNNKEQEYEKLDATIGQLLAIGKNLDVEKKLELFIDDLQWIDEISAEYLLRLINRTDITVRLLATARSSDSVAAIKSWLDKRNDYKHCLELVETLGYQEATKDWQSNGSIVLPSLDDTQVSQLIQMALKPADLALSNVLAREVKHFLTTEDNPGLSTLFVVETLNLLSDDKLYDDTDLSPVFVFEEGLAKFTERTEAQLTEDLHKIFNQLEDKYKDSFESKDGSFNLSSYAVMEERLRLIEQHLGKGYAHLMVFSHLTRAPFEPKLIEKFICALAQMESGNEQDNELIIPLKKQMNEACIEFEAHGLETLEEVYLLLDELERPRRHQTYVHRHRLVELFVGAAFKRMICGYMQTTDQKTSNRLEYLAREIFHRVIDDYISNHPLKKKHESSFSQDESKRLNTMQEAKNLNLKYLYDQNSARWTEPFFRSLNNLAVSYFKINRLPEAIALQEESKAILEPLNKEKPNDWTHDYSKILINLAIFYKNAERLDEAIILEQEAKTKREILYNKNNDFWAVDYARSLGSLAVSYQNIDRMPDAILLQEEAKAILEPRFKENAKDYMVSINNLAISYQKTGRPSEAILLQEKVITTLAQRYKESPGSWAEIYTETLNILALSYQDAERFDEAIEIQEEAKGILETCYLENKHRWVQGYNSILNNLAGSYMDKKRFHEAIALLEEAKTTLEPLYKENEAHWTNAYTANLNNLASSYKHTDRLPEAIALQEKAKAILKSYYKKNKGRWVEYYSNNLNNLAGSYWDIARFHEAIKLQEEAKAILKEVYHDNPDQWAEAYTRSLKNLSAYYNSSDRLLETITTQEEAKSVLEKLHQENPQKWTQHYLDSLIDLFISYEDSGITEGIIPLGEKIKGFYKKLYEAEPHNWVVDYTNCIISLAEIYKKTTNITNISKGIKLEQQAAAILEKLYEENPEQWKELVAELKRVENMDINN